MFIFGELTTMTLSEEKIASLSPSLLAEVVQEEVQFLHEQLHNFEGVHETFLRAKLAQEETEAHLKIAHQHLARKVKEAAELTDKVKGLESKIEEMNSSLKASEDAMIEMQHLLESRQKESQQQQQLWKDSLNHAENASSKWQEKYSELHRNCQEMERQMMAMKKNEDKYHRLQELWLNFNKVFEEGSSEISESSPSEFDEKSDGFKPNLLPMNGSDSNSFPLEAHKNKRVIFNCISQEEGSKKLYQNLFDISSQQPYHFFE